MKFLWNMCIIVEILAQLNCVYGIQNETIFMTVLNDEADSLSNQSFDRYEFILDNLSDREVIDFECKHDLENGGFYIVRKSPGNLPQMSLAAVDFFRNQEEVCKDLFDNLGSSECDASNGCLLNKKSYRICDRSHGKM